MRIFNAFLVMFGSVILFLLPLTTAIYDFRTDVRADTFSTTTGVGVTSANETLLADLYNDDIGSVDINSDVGTDNASASSYNATPRWLTIIGLTDNTTRTLEVSYDVDALTGFAAINTLLDRLPFIWMLMIIAFAPAALFAILTGKA